MHKSFTLGKLYLKLLHFKQISIPQRLRIFYYKAKHLKAIVRFRPIDVSSGNAEIHMLLHHKRIYEGAWAIYSLLFFSTSKFQVVIHDDGSLTLSDIKMLQTIFPGIKIIQREHADKELNQYFEINKLEQCKKLRDELIFGLKLFDPIFFSQTSTIILLDSDVLFFRKPLLLDESINQAEAINYYSRDNQEVYCLSESEIKTILPNGAISKFNPGLVKLKKDIVNFGRIESYLKYEGFWGKNGPNYFAELTIWALELSHAQTLPLPDDYAICAHLPAEFTFGHYCGGGYWASLFYTKGIPWVANRVYQNTNLL